MLRHVINFLTFNSMFSWVLTLCSVVVGHQRFKGPYCLHLQGHKNHSDQAYQ